uniref:Uncharacterized protein n=1 Tax=Anguilla anguilla TaxID=7936 RepID=A0A0E9PQU0_ANGAN
MFPNFQRFFLHSLFRMDVQCKECVLQANWNTTLQVWQSRPPLTAIIF